jgi:hypothetical protein
MAKYLEEISSRVDKFMTRSFSEDECIDDLQAEFRGVKRLSSFLPYRRVRLELKDKECKNIYVKISIPFPPFFKPNIDLELDYQFMYGETMQACIPKKIEAPWIKKVTGNIQFTENIIDSLDTSILEMDQDDILMSRSSTPEEEESLSGNSREKY